MRARDRELRAVYGVHVLISGTPGLSRLHARVDRSDLRDAALTTLEDTRSTIAGRCFLSATFPRRLSDDIEANDPRDRAN